MKKKRTPIEIYNGRASQPDFCHLDDISIYLLFFILKVEDDIFYAHRGIDPFSIWWYLRIWCKKGKIYGGGSTITQQLVKNLYFTFERSWIRKIKESVLALQFERTLSKDQILELYLNIIYFDNGQYGISDASRFYFGKKPKELTFNQAIFFTFLLPVVGKYNPLYHPEKYAAYRDKRIRQRFSNDALQGHIYQEIQRHGAECLDEELCHATKETDPYNKPGPLINERFGPGRPESLIHK